MGEGKRKGFLFFLSFGLLWEKERLTDFLVGVGEASAHCEWYLNLGGELGS
jgi:hypothetical protein